jgi:hypothetical protein
MKDERIIQIIPATGWTAVYRHEGGPEEEYPLIAWVLTECGNIVPVEAFGDIGSCGVGPDFVRFQYCGTAA